MPSVRAASKRSARSSRSLRSASFTTVPRCTTTTGTPSSTRPARGQRTEIGRRGDREQGHGRDGEHGPGDRHVLQGQALLDEVAHDDQHDEVEGRELGQLALAEAAQDDPEEGVDHDRAEDDAHQGATQVVYPSTTDSSLGRHRGEPSLAPEDAGLDASVEDDRERVAGRRVEGPDDVAALGGDLDGLGLEAVVVEDGEVALVGADLDRRRRSHRGARPRSRTARRARLAPDRRSGWSPAGRRTSPAPCPCARRAAA